MSADLRLNDFMNSETPERLDAAAPPTAISRRLKMTLAVVIGLGALGGLAIAWLAVTAPDRPDVDTSGKTMTVVVDKANESEVDEAELLAKKLANPSIITNYFNEHPPAEADHPLEPAIEVARRGLEIGRETIRDYTAVMHKQERICGKLLPKEVVELKIRYDSIASGMEQSPMSVYVKFLAPKKMAGREVIWKKGRNDDKLTVHEYVFGRNVQLDLSPTGMLASRGNRYPLTEIGFETLVLRMIEKGTRDLKHGECEVNLNRTAKINGRDCTMIEIVHPVEREHFEFHIARIFIDDELNVPLRYAAYSWPTEPGGEPVLEEEYTYTDIQLNVGLSDIDFDYNNPDYNFPNRK